MRYFALNHLHKNLTFNVPDYSRVNLSGKSFIETEKNGFAFGSSPSFPSYSSCPQITLIQLKDTRLWLLFLLATLCQPNAYQQENPVNCISIQACQSCDFGSFHINNEQPDKLSKFLF